MKKYTFAKAIREEICSMKKSLDSYYEVITKLENEVGPQLLNKYNENFGELEKAIFAEELECEILSMKQQMIQTAINRREPVDEADIDRQLDEYRQQRIKEAFSGNDNVLDLGSLKLELSLAIIKGDENDSAETDPTADYTVAGMIYRCFVPTDDEIALKQEHIECKQALEKAIAKGKEIPTRFPFSTEEMLSDPEKIEEFKEELNVRLHNAKKERQRLTKIVREILERTTHNG